MHSDSIVKFVTRKVQYVVACIADIIIQVHGLVNQKYELIVVDGTKHENIITISLWKKKIFFLERASRFVFNRCTCHCSFEECVINCLW